MNDIFKEVCENCKSSGGWDMSEDVEVYDEWIDCEICGGIGEIDYD